MRQPTEYERDLHHPYVKGASKYKPIIEAALASEHGVVIESGVDFDTRMKDSALRYAMARVARDACNGSKVRMRRLEDGDYLLVVTPKPSEETE